MYYWYCKLSSISNYSSISKWGGGISDLIRYTNGFKLLFYFCVILFIVFDICSTYFICNMLDVNRILKLDFILSENKKQNYYYIYYYYYCYYYYKL